MKRFIAVLIAGLSIGACSHSAAPTAPTLFLDPAGSYVLSGTVSGITDAGMIPLGNVRVELVNGDYRRSGISADDGQFAVDGLSAGAWTVTVSKAGYGMDARTVEIADNTSVSFELTPVESGDEPNPRPLPRRR
jgi:hypothetical protein